MFEIKTKVAFDHRSPWTKKIKNKTLAIIKNFIQINGKKIAK